MTSRIFLIRHGETEWSLNRQHTGSTDVPLTSNGEQQVKSTARIYVGDNKMVQPKNISHIYCSPRVRARRTLELLNLGVKVPAGLSTLLSSHSAVTITDLLQEWDYGDYEGLTVAEVRKLRNSRNLDQHQPWNVWRDGCERGETPQQVSDRLDKLIGEMKNILKSQSGETEGTAAGSSRDIVCVAHGHILSALALRWAEMPLKNGMRLLIETAGLGVLCFEHDDPEEPAVMLGGRPE